MLLPVTVGLLDTDGNDLPLTSVNGESLVGSDGVAPTSTVLRVDEAEQSFTFENIPTKPVPSLLRNFSAPVRLTSDVTDEQLVFLLAHDSNPFNRCALVFAAVTSRILILASVGQLVL
jgi:aminopeptidase N